MECEVASTYQMGQARLLQVYLGEVVPAARACSLLD